MGTELCGMRGHSRKGAGVVCAQGRGGRGTPETVTPGAAGAQGGLGEGGRSACRPGGARVKGSAPG